MLLQNKFVFKLFRAQINCVRLKSQKSYKEVRIPVPWGHVAGKWWGPTNKRPVLTLHGWQDNCGSFNRLIPLLTDNVGFLAIDFPGHGYSSRIPSGLYSYFSNYFILVQYIVNYFKWPEVSLMGHSMGAITSFIYTMLHPKNVDFMICIDALKPMIIENRVAEMQKSILKFPKLAQFEMDLKANKEPPSYTMEEIKKKICAPNKNSINIEYAHHIAERNTAPSKLHPGKYYFTRDPRLKAGELLNFPQEDSEELAQNIECPLFIAKAISSSYYEAKENFYAVLEILKKKSVDCQYHRMEGTHHFHLNNPEELARLINLFIEKHDVQSREVGGIKTEIIA